MPVLRSWTALAAVTPAGRTVTDGEAIRRSQQVWQSIGGQEVGTIWGHGS